MLESIARLEQKRTDLLTRIGRFSQKREKEYSPSNINSIIEDALELLWPIIRYADLSIEKDYAPDMPLIGLSLFT